MPDSQNPQQNPTNLNAANLAAVDINNVHRNEIQDWRWLVEQQIRKELGVPARYEPAQAKIEFHRRQLALLLDKANDAPRCAHVFADGRCCAAPRVKKGTLCYAHAQMEARKPKTINLPPLEDANAVMIWIMEVSRGLLDGQISERTAGLMFYGLQLAMVNARHTTFKETDPMEMVRTAPRNRRHRRGRASSPTTELTIKDAKCAKENGSDLAKTEPQSAQRKTEDYRACRDRAPSPAVEFGDGESSAIEVRNSGRSAEESEDNPGIESAKSIFSGVEGLEGVNRSGDRDIG